MPWVNPEFSYPEVPGFLEPLISASSQRFDQRRDAENSSRLTFCMGTFVTTGWGEYQMPEAFVFDCLFVGRPFVLTGWSFGGQPGLDPAPGVAPALVPTRFPRVSAGVVAYQVDKRGLQDPVHFLYSSAHMAFTVETRSPEEVIGQDVNIPIYELTHHFMFVGIGMKRVPRVKE